MWVYWAGSTRVFVLGEVVDCGEVFEGRSLLVALVHVGDAVLVGVDAVASLNSAVSMIAHTQQDRCEDRGGERCGEDRDFGGVVLGRPGRKAQLCHKQRHGEPNAREESDADQVDPFQCRVKTRAGNPGDEPGGGDDAKWLAEHERSPDRKRQWMRHRCLY